MSSDRAPWESHPQFTEKRLATIAAALLDVYYDAEKELSTPLDDNYTRGATTFGRQRNKLIWMCQCGEYPWLELGHIGMDLECKIGGVPFRFFSDDPDSPSKPGFWKNPSGLLFPVEDDDAVLLRFILEKPMDALMDAEMHFIGYNAAGEEVFRWRHPGTVNVVRSVDDDLPQAAKLPPAKAEPREPDQKRDTPDADAGTG
jgi:hypothetical protein